MDEKTMFCIIFFGVWAIVGAVFLLVTLILRTVRLRRAEQCAMTAPATVTELARHRNQHGGVYCPVVEFVANGQTVRVECGAGSRPARYQQGQRVTVCYDPNRPTRCYIQDDPTMVILERVFGFMGLGNILIGSLVAGIVELLA